MDQERLSAKDSSQPARPDLAAAEFAVFLLGELRKMAGRSPRLYADVQAVLGHAGIDVGNAQISEALQLLLDQGCVADLIPLQDGGLLLKVTGLPLETAHSDTG
jgi:hypothetical protein